MLPAKRWNRELLTVVIIGASHWIHLYDYMCGMSVLMLLLVLWVR